MSMGKRVPVGTGYDFLKGPVYLDEDDCVVPVRRVVVPQDFFDVLEARLRLLRLVRGIEDYTK